MDKSREIYVSTDVEADGPIPGPNSMLSLGSAAYLSVKKNMPRHWFSPPAGRSEKMPHTHRAVDDAIEQGMLFCNILAEVRKG